MNQFINSTVSIAAGIEVGTLVCTEVLVDNAATVDGRALDQEAVRRMMAAVIQRNLQQPV